jgi:hypothetical protein
MAATLNDVHSQLEQLNESIGQMVAMRQQESMERQRGVDDQKSFIASTVKNFFSSPLEALKEFSLLSLKMGFKMVESLDKLEMSNISDGRNTRNLLKELQTEDSFQIGGMLENLEMMTTASEKGIDLRGQGNKVLRNQLTELNKNGVQGQLLLNFTKDLVGQGFKKEQVKETLQRLADIGFYSIQSATTQLNMLKRMNQTMGITALADPEFGDNLRGLMADFVHDAPDTFKNAAIDMMKLMVLPEGQEQIILREAMGGDAALAELRLLGDKFAKAEERGDEVAKQRIQTELEAMVEEFAQRGKAEAQRYVEGMDSVSIALLKTQPFFGELLGMIDTFNLAAAAADRAEAVRQERAKGDLTFAGRPPRAGDTHLGHAYDEMLRISHDNLARVAERIQETALTKMETTGEAIKDGLITPIELAANATTTMSTEILKIPAAMGDFLSGAKTFAESVGTLTGVVARWVSLGLTDTLGITENTTQDVPPITTEPQLGQLREQQAQITPH